MERPHLFRVLRKWDGTRQYAPHNTAALAHADEHCSWNTFKANINQSVIEQNADLLVSTGLRDAGYEYLIVDDGWQNRSRAPDGRQQANLTRFPSGMEALGAYIHQAGLKYGIYSDNG